MFDILPWKRKKDNQINDLRREIDDMYSQFFGSDFLPSTYPFEHETKKIKITTG